MPVLDASFLIDAKRDPEQARPILETMQELAEPLLVPIQAAVEFASGIEDTDRGMMEVEESFQLVPIDPSIGRNAARMAQEAVRAGTFPGWADLQVAATAAHYGMFVVTADARHFEALPVPFWAYRDEGEPPG